MTPHEANHGITDRHPETRAFVTRVIAADLLLLL